MTTDTHFPKKLIFFRITSILFSGLVVCVFSLNGVLQYLAGNRQETKTGNALLGLAAIPNRVYDALPGGKYFLFELLGRWVLLSLAVFVCLLLLNSIRHRTVNIFVAGTGGLFLGLFALTWISLFIFLVAIVLTVAFWIIGLLKWIIAGILSLIFWPPVLFTLIGIVVLIGIVFLVAQRLCCINTR